ncbi:hypothetical protein [Ornithinibacillus halotolerans]|uniref:Uncharacterized protein n=1 Tax=Ornithinibacillus halotolerans TaxID=1274357 RepID=A0A916S9I8_9BACI|nr:hypothetical protein [Ornithinibacillus halotolerans]GGA90031.1 hypothetical protein GCM10008025_35780 [Ornithinibacillus halotolerans]
MTYNLTDGAMIVLTVANMKTMNGQIFGDSPIPADVKTTYLKAEVEAIKWLEGNSN